MTARFKEWVDKQGDEEFNIDDLVVEFGIKRVTAQEWVRKAENAGHITRRWVVRPDRKNAKASVCRAAKKRPTRRKMPVFLPPH